MTIAEHRLTIFHQLEELTEESLIELEKIIASLKVKQKSSNVSDLSGIIKDNKIILSYEEICKSLDFDEDMENVKLAQQRDSEIENGSVKPLSHAELMARLRNAH